MIKISSRSWHYRLLKWAQHDSVEMPKTLCGYFWTVVLILVGPVLVVLGVLALIALYVGAILESWWWMIVGPLLVAVGLVVAVLVLVLAVLVGEILSNLYHGLRPNQESKGHSTARLIGEFIGAKKRRICPLIEVVGEEPTLRVVE